MNPAFSLSPSLNVTAYSLHPVNPTFLNRPLPVVVVGLTLLSSGPLPQIALQRV